MMKLADFVCCYIFVASIISASSSSSSSSYDSTECDPHSSRARTGRARLIASIPCDLTKQSYCNLPGEAYPWNAVKKFVYDNQGLVRRMYGDMRHIFVMQSELENEVDFDDMHDSADKYSKAFNSHNQRQMKAKKVAVERKNFRSDAEPYFRPAQRPSAVNTKQKMKPPKVPATEQVDSNSLVDNMIKSNVEALEQEVKESLLESSTKTTSTSTTPSNVPTIDDEQLIASIFDKNDATTIDKVVLNLFNNISSALSTSTTTLPSTLKTSDLLSTPEEDANIVKLSSTLKNESVIKLEAELEEEVFNGLEQLASGVAEVETSTESDTMDRNNSKEPQTTTTETQLFQDTLQKEKEPTPVVNRRGVNACPVKEEVVAPFWGNNTRGEVLALLNVYPFEQYINWEKCTNEHEQMYCRTGCVCEQQYRLHRLLAYNPLDACRGIFSDWFRFPSCCICKCYDIPFDYRVTSRSPRGSEKLLQSEDKESDEQFPMFEDDINFFDPE